MTLVYAFAASRLRRILNSAQRRSRGCSIPAARARTIPYVCGISCECAAGMRHLAAAGDLGTVPNLGDLTTDEYSFVIKCPASRHLPVRRKTPPPCRGGGSKSRRGFPPTYHSARETKGSLRPSAWRTKRPLWPPRGKQKGIMAAARRTEGALRPHGCETPSAPPGLVPLRGGTVHSWRLWLPTFRSL